LGAGTSGVTGRILVIEDNLANLELITYLLRAFGYEVSTATDGSSGLERARADTYDLVLTDILMPQLDGFKLAQEFKADSRLASTPLVAITALAMTGDREKILGAGFDGYISKPIDPQTFPSQIEAFMSRNKRGKSSDH
jgi:CheY-like chemotaxis protein